MRKIKNRQENRPRPTSPRPRWLIRKVLKLCNNIRAVSRIPFVNTKTITRKVRHSCTTESFIKERRRSARSPICNLSGDAKYNRSARLGRPQLLRLSFRERLLSNLIKHSFNTHTQYLFVKTNWSRRKKSVPNILSPNVELKNNNKQIKEPHN